LSGGEECGEKGLRRVTGRHRNANRHRIQLVPLPVEPKKKRGVLLRKEKGLDLISGGQKTDTVFTALSNLLWAQKGKGEKRRTVIKVGGA